MQYVCADRDGNSRVCVFPAGFGSNFRIMVGSASGTGSTFKAFLGSTRVRVPLSNKIRVRVSSTQYIYGSLRVRVRIFGPVKTSTLGAQCSCIRLEQPYARLVLMTFAAGSDVSVVIKHEIQSVLFNIIYLF